MEREGELTVSLCYICSEDALKQGAVVVREEASQDVLNELSISTHISQYVVT